MKDTIYQCFTIDNKTNPPKRILVFCANSCTEAVDWLEDNGGGLFRNILHNYEFIVESNV